MDPLFERRQLTSYVHVDSRYLQRNIQASILAQLRHKYEGTCVAEGYIQQNSITIVEYSLGRANLIKGGIDYAVKFQADICMPHPGQVFRAPVTLKSKIGIHADVVPIKVLLPRDLHIGNPEFEAIKESQEIEFEVIGSRFQQGDDGIVVLAKLRTVIQPEPMRANAAASSSSEEPVIAAPIANAAVGTSEEKRMVTVPVESTKLSEVKRKRLRTAPSGETKDEPKPEGSA